MHKGLEAHTLNAELLTQLTLKPPIVDQFRSGEMLDNYSLDWMLESLVQALGPSILMAGVGAHTQALSPLLTTSAATLTNAPFVFGVLQADLLRALASSQALKYTVWVLHPGSIQGSQRILRMCSGDFSVPP
jgi:hypothetical protein